MMSQGYLNKIGGWDRLYLVVSVVYSLVVVVLLFDPVSKVFNDYYLSKNNNWYPIDKSILDKTSSSKNPIEICFNHVIELSSPLIKVNGNIFTSTDIGVIRKYYDDIWYENNRYMYQSGVIFIPYIPVTDNKLISELDPILKVVTLDKIESFVSKCKNYDDFNNGINELKNNNRLLKYNNLLITVFFSLFSVLLVPVLIYFILRYIIISTIVWVIKGFKKM